MTAAEFFSLPRDGETAHAVGRVYCSPQGRANDEWMLRLLERRVAELALAVEALGERVDNLATGFPSPAKAAVTEGAEPSCNDSAQVIRERPEPSPHFTEPDK